MGGTERRARACAVVALVATVAGMLLAAAPADAAGALGSDPRGTVDVLAPSDAGRIRLTGWAFDGDAPTVAVSIHAYLGGPVGAPGVEGHDLGPADRERPDVARVFPGVGTAHGFDTELSTDRSGAQIVYVYAVNLAGTAGGSTLLTTRTVTLADPDPFGAVDAASSPEAARVRVVGWGLDRNAVTTGIAIRVSIGAPATSAAAEVHDVGPAIQSRPDVARAFPEAGAAHGFDVTFTTDRVGRQPVYVYGVNAPGTPGKDVLIATRTVDVRAPEARYTPITPTRIIDSRRELQVGPHDTPWGTGATRDVRVAGVAGVPSDADAVVLNTTVTRTTTASHLTVWPSGEARPMASSINWDQGWTIANAVTVKVGSSGSVSIYNAQGLTDVVLDVVGYYRDVDGAGFTAVTPRRVQDSRADGPAVGAHRSPWGAGTSRDVPIAGANGVPDDAVAVALNVTATNTTSPSFLTVWPAGGGRPLASSLNWDRDWTIPNAVTVAVGAGGAISVYNDAGLADVVIDVVGWFEVGAGEAFHPLSPARVQDSRGGTVVGRYDTPWTRGVSRDVVVARGKIPPHASAVVTNTTVTRSTGGSHLTVWPSGQVRPLASSLNWQAGWTIANAVTSAVGAGGAVGVYNDAGAVDVVIDTAGWYG